MNVRNTTSGPPLNLLMTAWQRPIECQAVDHDRDPDRGTHIVEMRLVNTARPYHRRTVRVCQECLSDWESHRGEPLVWLGGLMVLATLASTDQADAVRAKAVAGRPW